MKKAELLRALQDRIDHASGKRKSLNGVPSCKPRQARRVLDVGISYSRTMDDPRVFGSLIIYTDRVLTTDGGDGQRGFDGIDFEEIYTAAVSFLEENGAWGLFNKIEVHQHPQRIYEDELNEEIDALFH